MTTTTRDDRTHDVVARSPRDGGPWPIFRSDAEAPVRLAGPLTSSAIYWRKYAVFTGRASRSEFWAAWMFMTIGYGLILIGLPRLLGQHPGFTLTAGFLGPAFSSGLALANASGDGLGDPSTFVGALTHYALVAFTVVTFVPTLAVSFRRMHDIGLPGWVALAGLGGTGLTGVLLVAALIPSRPAGARFDRPVGRAGVTGRLPRSTTVRAAALVGVVVAVTVAVCVVAVPSTPRDMVGTWRLTAMSGPGATSERLPSAPVVLTLAARSLTGSDSCAEYQADLAGTSPWRATSSVVSSIVCGDDDGAARAAFHRDLARVTRATLSGHSLRLVGSDGVELDFVRP